MQRRPIKSAASIHFFLKKAQPSGPAGIELPPGHPQYALPLGEGQDLLEPLEMEQYEEEVEKEEETKPWSLIRELYLENETEEDSYARYMKELERAISEEHFIIMIEPIKTASVMAQCIQMGNMFHTWTISSSLFSIASAYIWSNRKDVYAVPMLFGVISAMAYRILWESDPAHHYQPCKEQRFMKRLPWLTLRQNPEALVLQRVSERGRTYLHRTILCVAFIHMFYRIYFASEPSCAIPCDLIPRGKDFLYPTPPTDRIDGPSISPGNDLTEFIKFSEMGLFWGYGMFTLVSLIMSLCS